ncbi:hypothetical protein OVA24_21260 [Luteolibacter sp. SL250]|uniref:hypothetical protein n=1 Tax=Luteolibacter sp. SL250 TaxID=2995170 RepID=UPI002271BE62|nr:hypothetical protein [Luteolibacter sp. SL250]WAC19750.1 hypothetical protein OVA24_21260 [Luteolibacter sp. SL250]
MHIPASAAAVRVFLPRRESDFSRHGFAWLVCCLAGMMVPVVGTAVRYLKLRAGSGGRPIHFGIPVREWTESGTLIAAMITVLVIPAILVADWHAALRGAKAWRDRLIAMGVACLLCVLFFLLVNFLQEGGLQGSRLLLTIFRAGIFVAATACLYHWLAARDGKMGAARRAIVRCFRFGK